MVGRPDGPVRLWSPVMTTTTLVRLPEAFRRIRLELAREHAHPAGSAAFGYQFVAPLLPDGRLDVDHWRSGRDHCRVVRHRPGEAHVVGRLVHRPGGSWAFRYGGLSDEAGHRFQDERFVAGEYVSVRDGDEQHTFKVVSVDPV